MLELRADDWAGIANLLQLIENTLITKEPPL
jgi:hypothetical protein